MAVPPVRTEDKGIPGFFQEAQTEKNTANVCKTLNFITLASFLGRIISIKSDKLQYKVAIKKFMSKGSPRL